MKGKKTRGLVGLMLAIAMVFTCANAFAIGQITNPALKTVTTKVIVQKLQIAPTDTTSITNSGEDQQATYAGKKYDKSKYGDVQFTVYKLDGKQVEASKKKGQAIADAVEAAVKNGNPSSAYGATVFQDAATVDDNGQINFSYTTGTTKQEFKGYFVVVESKPSATIKEKAKPMFVALPWQKRNAKNGEYLSTVYLYPKNKVESPELVLHKTSKAHGQDTVVNFAGVNFTLYKGEVGQGTVLKDNLKTDKNGNIKITDMSVGKYYLVENETQDKVDGVLDEATKYNPKEGVGTYLVSKYAQNDKNNKLYFEIKSDGTLVKADDTLFDNLINYERPNIKKTITNDTANGTFDVGEKIKYKVEVPIADNVKDYTKYEYEDIPRGLKIDIDSIKVKAGDSDLAKGTDYTLTPKGDGYIINFIVGNGVTDKVVAQAGKSFVVTYEASIKSTAVTTADNTVNLTYSNGGKDRYDTDKKTVKTYGAKFRKEDGGLFDIGLGDADNSLEGAKFAVARINNGTAEWLYEENGAYVWKTTKDVNSATLKVLTSGENGAFEIQGLKEGTYYLDELEAPENYELPAENEYGIREAKEFTPMTQESDVLNIISVTNKRNPDLPMTGSERLLVFTAIGLVIIGCGYVIIRRRRKTDR